jgi:NADPH-dependent ferric siderophore reductase
MTSQALPLPASVLSIPGVQPLELHVASVDDIGPRMRRIVLSGDALADFTFSPGQDVMLVLGQAGDRPLSRRYSIRRHERDARTLELNIVAHGIDGPGARWADNARPGDAINGVGPRGKITLDPDAEWHLFIGDETAAPAMLCMLEASPVPASAYLELMTAEDQLPIASADVGGNVHWLHRGATPAHKSELMHDALRAADLPAGRGHVYIAGEVQTVAQLRDIALSRGLSAEQVSAKAYWGRGRANAPRGEPD